jgi:hypothetical protein
MQLNRAKLKCLAPKRAGTPRVRDVVHGRSASRRTAPYTHAEADRDPWSVHCAKGLLCVVPLGPGRSHAPHPHAPDGRTAIGHWLAAPPIKRHWLTAAPPLPMPRPTVR